MVSFPGVSLPIASPRRRLHSPLEEEEVAEGEVEICDIAMMSGTLLCLKGRCVGM